MMMMMPRPTLLARHDDYPDCSMFHDCSDDDDAKDHLAGPDSPSLKEGGLCRVRIVQEGGSTSEMIRNFNNNIINDINNMYAFKPGSRRDQQ